MRLEDAVAMMKQSGVEVPFQAQRMALDLQIGRDGAVQMWICKKCVWTHKTFVKTIEVNCAKGHSCDIMWSRENSTLK